MIAFTIIAANYAALAEVLARSFTKHHPDDQFVVVVVDRSSAPLDDLAAIAEIVTLDEIDFGHQGWGRMALSYDVTEFSTAVKPFAARHLLARGQGTVLYLDPDILVLDSLHELAAGCVDHPFVLTPHALQPMERDGRLLSEYDILRCGVYNLGFIGLGPEAGPFLEWWCERLRRDAVIDPTNALFTDQRWIDLAVPLFGPHIELSPAYNVAYWNVDQRPITEEGGRYFAGGAPLAFFHFSGYDLRRPYLLSKFMGNRPRVLMSEQPALRRLADEYAALLVASGHETQSKTAYTWSALPPDLVLTKAVRRHYRNETIRSDHGEISPPPDPFENSSYDEFVEWLGAPVPGDPTGVARFHAILLESRPDLLGRFQGLRFGDAAEFYEWLWLEGHDELGDTCLVTTPLRKPLQLASSELDLESPRVQIVSAQAGRVGHDVAVTLAVALADAGVASAHRLLGDVIFRPSEVPVNDDESQQKLPSWVVVLCCGIDDLSAMRRATDVGSNGVHVIGVVPPLRQVLDAVLDDAVVHVDELWVASSADRRRVRARTSKPVSIVPLPATARTSMVASSFERADFDVDPKAFLFVATLDADENIDDANTLGVIEAYIGAFPPSGDTTLLIGLLGDDERLLDLELLRERTRDRLDVVVRASIDTTRAAPLIAMADAFVTLHHDLRRMDRVTEAQLAGVSIVATAFGANMDVMDTASGFLVPFATVVPGSGGGVLPIVDAAAVQLRRVRQQAEERVTKIDVGRQQAAERSSGALGTWMRARLAEIWRTDDET